MLDSRPRGRGFEPHRRHCVVSLSKNINPSLVLVQPRKTRPFITERLLMGRKESNQTNKSLYLVCNEKNAFFTSEQPKRHKLWSCQKMCDALHYLLDTKFIQNLRFGSKLYRQIVGIPMGTNCAPLVADLFLFCYERDFNLSDIKLILLKLLPPPPDI